MKLSTKMASKIKAIGMITIRYSVSTKKIIVEYAKLIFAIQVKITSKQGSIRRNSTKQTGNSLKCWKSLKIKSKNSSKKHLWSTQVEREMFIPMSQSEKKIMKKVTPLMKTEPKRAMIIHHYYFKAISHFFLLLFH